MAKKVSATMSEAFGRREALKLENLKLLDFGKVGAAFDHELRHVVLDCMDRSMDKRPRKVSITFTIKPVVPVDSPADCSEVEVECEVTSTVPKRRTQIYKMRPTAKGELAFHPDLPAEPDEGTLYDDDAKKQDDQAGPGAGGQ
jgi:hypothetical protein